MPILCSPPRWPMEFRSGGEHGSLVVPPVGRFDWLDDGLDDGGSWRELLVA